VIHFINVQSQARDKGSCTFDESYTYEGSSKVQVRDPDVIQFKARYKGSCTFDGIYTFEGSSKSSGMF